LLSDIEVSQIKDLLDGNSDYILDEVVKIVNTSLLCKDGGTVVRRTPEEEAEIKNRHSGSHP
jgi:hypothetical protein